MKISNILKQKGAAVWKIRPEYTVQDAIRKLCEHHIGALVVERKNGTLLGILTERDIMVDCGFKCSQLEQLARPYEKVCPRLVQDIMTTDVITGAPGDELESAMAVMTHNRVRHLPILDGHKLVGIVSIGDLVHAHLSETAIENRRLREYVSGEPA